MHVPVQAAIVLVIVLVGIPWLGIAPIGGANANKVVPMATWPSREPLAPSLEQRVSRLTDELTALGTAKAKGPAAKRRLLRRVVALSHVRQRALLRLLARDPASASSVVLPAALERRLARRSGVQVEHAVTLTGWYRFYHRDDFANESGDVFRDQLVTSDGRVISLDPAGSTVSDPLTRARLKATRISVRGYALGKQLLATHVQTVHSGLQAASTSTGTTTTATTGTVKVAVIVADFADTTTPFDMNALKNQFQGNPGNDVVSYFNEASYGKMTLAPSFFGPYKLSENAGSFCSGYNQDELMQLANSDINYTQYSRIIFIMNCSGSGASAMSPLPISTPDGDATMSMIHEDAPSAQRLYVHIHELSHTLGGFNMHASDFICRPDAFEAPSHFDQGCDTPEYSDSFDVLGGDGRSIHQLDPYHKWNAGWLSTTQYPTVTAPGTYTLAPYEAPGSGIVALNIPRGNTGTSLTVEYRQPVGFDSDLTQCGGCTVTQGASIRLSGFNVDGAGGGSDTELLDTTPGSIDDGSVASTSDAHDGALLPGKSFTDPEYGITISALSAGGSGMSVGVTLGSRFSCARGIPKLSTPVLASGAGGLSPTYTFTVTNADSSACAANTFRFLPTSTGTTRYTATPDVFSLAPGASTTVSLVAALPQMTTAGTYTLSPGQVASDSVGNCTNCAYTTRLPSLSYQYAPAADSSAPTAPASPVATALGAGVVSLAWGPSTDNVGVVGYNVFRAGVLVGTTSAPAFVDAGVVGGLTYQYSIQAFDARGNVSTAATVSATTAAKKDITAPTPPLVTAAATDRTATLSWTPSLDLGGGVAAYKVSPCLSTQCTLPAAASSVQIGGLATQTRYDFTITAVDADGNSAASTNTTVYTAPLGDSAPTQPQRFYTPSGGHAGATLSWTASSGATGYRVYRNGRPLAVVTGTSYTDPAPGSHSYYVQAVDGSGALSTPTPTLWAMGPSTAGSDTTPPTASLSSPLKGATLSGTTTLTAQASDNVGIYEVDFFVDGQQVGSSRTSPYSVKWDTTRVSNGTHWLNVVAYDTGANWSSDGGYTVVTANGSGATDTTPPTVSLLSPLAGSTVSGSVSLAAAASDNVGVARVEFSVDAALVATSTTAPYGCTWDASKAAPGSHSITATAYDAAGNKSSTSLTVNVAAADTTPPTVSITSPADGATVSGTIQVQASADDNVRVTQVELLVDGTSSSTLSAAPWTFSLDTMKLTDGSHTLTTKAYDAAGNVASSQVTVTVQNGPADTTVPSKPSNLKAAVTGTTQIALFWTPSTDNVGVVGYDVYRDGTMVGQTTLPNYLDTGLTPGTSHVYSVRARDAAGNTSLASSNLNAKTVALSTASTGTVAGVVYNSSGRPVANAIVQLTGNGITKSAKTNSSGVYKFTSLPPGDYTLALTMPATAGASGTNIPADASVTVLSGRTIVVSA